MQKKKLLPIVISIVLIIGFSLGVRGAKAGFFDDVLKFLRTAPNIVTPKEINNDSRVVLEEKKAQPPVTLYKPVIDYEEAVVSAVESASPSVVSIIISKDLPIVQDCAYDPFGNVPEEFRQFFGNQPQFSVPCEKGKQKQEVGGGSGFIVSEDGMILTNKHVVADTGAEYTVLTNDGKKYGALVLARDPLQDLAVIKIDAPLGGLKAAKLGNSDTVKLGQTAIAIGNSLGEFRNTVSVGVISGLARTITASGDGIGSEQIRGVMQTDAAINPGNSGGPLLNLKGEVIGINTAIASGAQNIGFSIPINQAKRDINSVKTTGSIKTPYLGIRYVLVNEDIAKKQSLAVGYGALIRGTSDGPGVITDSPAAKAGLKAEDIILELDGEKITEEKPLTTMLQKYSVGDLITLKVRRGEEELVIRMALGERPEK